MTVKAKVLVLIYTTYGHCYQLALDTKKGLEAAGAEVTLAQVPETLPKEVLEKIHAPPKPEIPVATLAHLESHDAFILGFPTRYGTAPAQFKAFWDSTGSLWQAGKLVGKMATVFTSSSTQHGGLESTVLTFLPNLIHHGIIYVPMGYSNPVLFEAGEILGATQYGAGTITGPDASRKISDKEHAAAVHHGTHFGKVVHQYLNGRSVSA